VLYGHVGSAAINTRIKMMNRRKRIGVLVDSHSAHLSRLIFGRYGLGEVTDVHFGLLLLGFSGRRWIDLTCV
jgi:hypothetical protein